VRGFCTPEQHRKFLEGCPSSRSTSRTTASDSVKRARMKLVDRSKKNAYDDEAPMKKRSWIPKVY
jgi:hypothetical protein